MPLDKLVCGLLETAINTLQQLDSSAQQRRKMLDGTIIGVTVKEFNNTLYFVISTEQIDILADYQGEADCLIRLNLSALPALQNNHQLTALIKSEQLEVEGDIQLVQQFAQLLTAMDIDWEEFLSSKIGSLLAHKFCYHLKQGRQDIARRLTKSQAHTAQLISEELKIVPSPLQVAYFCEQVGELEKQCAQLETRIAQRFNRI